MNYRQVVNQLGMLLLVLSGGVLLMTAFAVVEAMRGIEAERTAAVAFAVTGLVGTLVGAAVRLSTRGRRRAVGRREATLLVVVSWFVGGLLAATPFRIWAELAPAGTDLQSLDRFAHCFFEAISGLSTCGATILSDIEAMPRSFLLWRALMQWIGGLGIVVLFVAVLPTLGVSGKRMYLTESTGVTPEGLRPQVRETARVLWMIYVGLTLLQIILLLACGIGPFNAICHAFASISTGGYSPLNASAAGLNSAAAEIVIIVFMALGGVNFALYYQLLRGRWRLVTRDPELRLYAALLAGGTILIAGTLLWTRQQLPIVGMPTADFSALEATRQAAFSTVSIATTTGYCTADYSHWPALATGTLMFLGMVGGCGGSTSSGIKVTRLLIAMKLIWQEVEREFRPAVVRPLRVGSATIDRGQKIAVAGMVIAAVAIVGVGTMLLMTFESHQGIDTTTALSAAVAMQFNIGPGLGRVGPSYSFGWMTAPSLYLCSLLMVMGRLEIFAVLAVVSTRFWRDA